MNQPIKRMLGQVHEFNGEIINLPIPNEPTMLEEERKKWALTALREEIAEFEEAETIEDEADALIDLTYFALGRLLEMGLLPGVLFDEVHEANMKKRQGSLSKRPHSKGHDAIKPDGWQPPDLSKYTSLTKEDVDHFIELTTRGETS